MTVTLYHKLIEYYPTYENVQSIIRYDDGTMRIIKKSDRDQDSVTSNLMEFREITAIEFDDGTKIDAETVP